MYYWDSVEGLGLLKLGLTLFFYFSLLPFHLPRRQRQLRGAGGLEMVIGGANGSVEGSGLRCRPVGPAIRAYIQYRTVHHTSHRLSSVEILRDSTPYFSPNSSM